MATARRSTALDANGPGREHFLERLELGLGADSDHDVADLDLLVGVRCDVERAVRFAERDHDRAGRAPDRELADGLARLWASRPDLDLLEPEVGARMRRDELEEGRDLRLQRELCHLDPCR